MLTIFPLIFQLMTYFEYMFSGEFIFILGKWFYWLVLVCFVLIELSVSLNSVGKINAITFKKKNNFITTEVWVMSKKGTSYEPVEAVTCTFSASSVFFLNRLKNVRHTGNRKFLRFDSNFYFARVWLLRRLSKTNFVTASPLITTPYSISSLCHLLNFVMMLYKILFGQLFHK